MRRSVLGLLVLTSLLYSLNWQIETVEEEPVGGFSFALDRQGHPWILFGRDSVLYLKHKDSNGWKTEVIDTTGVESPRISINGGEIWVAQGGYWGLWAYHKEGDGWSKTLVDSKGGELDLAVDSKGLPHICYIRWIESGKYIRYATIKDG